MRDSSQQRKKAPRRSAPKLRPADLTPALLGVLMLVPEIPQPRLELRFDRPTCGRRPRKWRFDAAWPRFRVAIECEGAIWTGGAHTRGKHFLSDLEKYNAATEQGWRVLRYTGDCFEKRPQQVAEQIYQVLLSASKLRGKT